MVEITNFSLEKKSSEDIAREVVMIRGKGLGLATFFKDIDGYIKLAIEEETKKEGAN